MRRPAIVLVLHVFAIFIMAAPLDQNIDETGFPNNEDPNNPPDGISYDFDDGFENENATDIVARDRKCWKHFGQDESKKDGREGKTFCQHVKPHVGDPFGWLPEGSGFYWNVFIKPADDDDVTCSCLKGEIKKQDFCQAMTLWKCRHDAKKREVYATFFESIFCNSERMVKAIEQRTVPKVKTGCSKLDPSPDLLGRGASNAIAAVFNLLGGSISRGRT